MTKKHPNKQSPRFQQRKFPQEGNNNNNNGNGGYREDREDRQQRPRQRQNHPPPPRSAPRDDYTDHMSEALYNEHKNDGSRDTRPPSPIDEIFESYEGVIGHQEYRASNRHQNQNPLRKCPMPPPNHPCFEDDRRAEVLKNSRESRSNDVRGSHWDAQNNARPSNSRPSNNNFGSYKDDVPPLANRVQSMHVEDRGPPSGRGHGGRHPSGPRRENLQQNSKSYDEYQEYQEDYSQQQSGGYGRQNPQPGYSNQIERSQSSQGYGRQDHQQGYGRREEQPGGYRSQNEPQGYGRQNHQPGGGYGNQNEPSQEYGRHGAQPPHGYGRQDQRQGEYSSPPSQGYCTQEDRQGYCRQREQHGYGRRDEQSGGYYNQNEPNQGYSKHNQQPDGYGRQAPHGNGSNHRQPAAPRGQSSRQPFQEEQFERPPNQSFNSARDQYPPRREETLNKSYRAPPDQFYQNQGPSYDEQQGGSQQQYDQGGRGYQRSNSDQNAFGNRARPSSFQLEPPHSDRQGHSQQKNQGAPGGFSGNSGGSSGFGHPRNQGSQGRIFGSHGTLGGGFSGSQGAPGGFSGSQGTPGGIFGSQGAPGGFSGSQGAPGGFTGSQGSLSGFSGNHGAPRGSSELGYDQNGHNYQQQQPANRRGSHNHGAPRQMNQRRHEQPRFDDNCQNRHDHQETSSNRSFQHQGSFNQRNQRRPEEPNFDSMVIRGNRFERYAEEKKKREEEEKNPRFDQSFQQHGNRFADQKNGSGQVSERSTPVEERPVRKYYRNGSDVDFQAPSSEWRPSGSSDWDLDFTTQNDSQTDENRLDDVGKNGNDCQNELVKSVMLTECEEDEKQKKKKQLLSEGEDFRKQLAERMAKFDGMVWSEEMNRQDEVVRRTSRSTTPDKKRGFEIHPSFKVLGGRPKKEDVLKVILKKEQQDKNSDSAETPIMGATSDQEDW